jgi:hypothetical protein
MKLIRGAHKTFLTTVFVVDFTVSGVPDTTAEGV